MSTPSRGFTLVELMVAISVLAILLAVAAPSFNEFVANTKVRNVAENFYSGIQKARAEAIRSNELVEFVLTNSGKSWEVRVPGRAAAEQLIDSKTAAEGGAAAVVVNAGTVTTLTFNGLGALTAPTAAVELNFSHPLNSACDNLSLAVRCVNVLVSLGGQSRLCEPERPTGDRRGCN